MKLEDSQHRFENVQYAKFHESCPVAAELYHEDGHTDGRTDRQTDMTKLIVAFRNFASAPKIAA